MVIKNFLTSDGHLELSHAGGGGVQLAKLVVRYKHDGCLARRIPFIIRVLSGHHVIMSTVIGYMRCVSDRENYGTALFLDRDLV